MLNRTDASTEIVDKMANAGPGLRTHHVRGELKSGDPSFRAIVDGIDITRRHVEAVGDLQKLKRFFMGEPQVILTQFEDLMAAAQARQL